MAVFDKVRGEISNVASKVTIDNFTDAIQSLGQDKAKAREAKITSMAPPGVVHAYSVVLTHVIAPLWPINTKSVGVLKPISYTSPEVVALAQAMDKKGVDVENHIEQLQNNMTLATAYITILVTKLLVVESVDYFKGTYTEIVNQISRDVRFKGEYEEHLNDETVAHDQTRRKLIEVGGTWKRAYATDLNMHGDAIRRRLMYNLMLASVCFRYIYTDESLHFMCDALASQLYLLNYSESLVTLVAGTKGAQYVAKYIIHLSPAMEPAVIQDCVVATPQVASLALQEITQLVQLAFMNLVHRNDTADTIINAFSKAIDLASQQQLASLFAFCIRVLHRTYACDLGVLVHLLDTVRQYAVYPAPIGSGAVQLMNAIVANIRNVNALQRRLCSSLFVAGAEMRSFRRQPAHIITAPYCSRSYIFQKLYLNAIDTQRGSNPALPVALESGTDPFTGAALGVPFDDAVHYLANTTANVFQSVYELCSGVDEVQENANIIELAKLFSLQPYTLCPYYPSILQFLQHEKNYLGDPSTTPNSAFAKVAELFITVMDHNKPMKGQRKYRLESPRPPIFPLSHIVSTESDDMNDVLKQTIDKHWRYCDQRVMDKETAALHPKKELSLSHFIESYIKLVVAGGGGLLRRVITSILHMRTMYPGAVPQFRFYLLPLGLNNDVASWLARGDPLYKQRVFDPLLTMPQKSVDTPTPEALNNAATACLESLMLRNIVNDYLLDATHPNDMVIYQLEGTMTDGSTQYIPWVSSCEIGVHLNQAAQTEEIVKTVHDGISTTSFCAEPTKLRDRSASGLAMQKTSSSPHLQRGASAIPPPSLSNASFGGSGSLVGGGLASATTYIQIGDIREPVHRLMVRLHGARGLPLSTKKHPADNVDVRHVASGVEILDWISTSFHQYEPGAALRAAQVLMDTKLLITVAVPPNRDPSRFLEAALYTVAQREASDEEPLVVPCTRNKCIEAAHGIMKYVDDTPNITIPAPIKLRVTYQPMVNDLCYAELADSNMAPVRDVISLKLKSTGGSGDVGSLPDPTNLMLHMTINEVEKRRPTRARELVDQHEHYQIRFGEGHRVDHKTVLTIENKTPVVSSNQLVGMYCAVDGDVVGPYTTVRIRPITTGTGPKGRGASSAQLQQSKQEPNCATITLMSYMDASSGVV